MQTITDNFVFSLVKQCFLYVLCDVSALCFGRAPGSARAVQCAVLDVKTAVSFAQCVQCVQWYVCPRTTTLYALVQVWISRTKYSVHAFEPSGGVRWNLSYSDYAPFSFSHAGMPSAHHTHAGGRGRGGGGEGEEGREGEGEGEGGEGCRRVPVIAASTEHGSLYHLDVEGRDILWAHTFDPLTVVSSVYYLRDTVQHESSQHREGREKGKEEERKGGRNGGREEGKEEMIKLPHLYIKLSDDAVNSFNNNNNGNSNGNRKGSPENDNMHESSNRNSDDTNTNNVSKSVSGGGKNKLALQILDVYFRSHDLGSNLFIDLTPEGSLFALTNPSSNPSSSASSASSSSSFSTAYTELGMIESMMNGGRGSSAIACVPHSPFFPACLLGFHILPTVSLNPALPLRSDLPYLSPSLSLPFPNSNNYLPLAGHASRASAPARSHMGQPNPHPHLSRGGRQEGGGREGEEAEWRSSSYALVLTSSLASVLISVLLLRGNALLRLFISPSASPSSLSSPSTSVAASFLSLAEIEGGGEGKNKSVLLPSPPLPPLPRFDKASGVYLIGRIECLTSEVLGTGSRCVGGKDRGGEGMRGAL